MAQSGLRPPHDSLNETAFMLPQRLKIGIPGEINQGIEELAIGSPALFMNDSGYPLPA